MKMRTNQEKQEIKQLSKSVEERIKENQQRMNLLIEELAGGLLSEKQIKTIDKEYLDLVQSNFSLIESSKHKDNPIFKMH